jgi:hypothetical protein
MPKASKDGRWKKRRPWCVSSAQTEPCVSGVCVRDGPRTRIARRCMSCRNWCCRRKMQTPKQDRPFCRKVGRLVAKLIWRTRK